LPSILVFVAIVLALSLFVIAEVLISYQKYQLKRRYIEELDDYEAKKKSSGTTREKMNSCGIERTHDFLVVHPLRSDWYL